MNKEKRIKMLEDMHSELYDPDPKERLKKKEEAIRKQEIKQMQEERIKDTGLI